MMVIKATFKHSWFPTKNNTEAISLYAGILLLASELEALQRLCTKVNKFSKTCL